MSEKQKFHRENNIELLKLYYDEWKYRLDNFRKHMTQLVILIFFTSSLPITVNIFNDIQIPKMPLLVFPISGLLLSIVFLWYCFSEASRIATLDLKIKLIISENFPVPYAKTALIHMSNKKIFAIFNKRMTIWVPLALTIIEVCIAVFMIYLIQNDAIM